MSMYVIDLKILFSCLVNNYFHSVSAMMCI